MNILTFDTHEYVKKLKSVGFSEEQAEAITDLQKTTAAYILDQLRHDYKSDDLTNKLTRVTLPSTHHE